MNFWDISILVLVAVFVGLALFRLRKKKKNGCPGCCSCCSGCAPVKTGAARQTNGIKNQPNDPISQGGNRNEQL